MDQQNFKILNVKQNLQAAYFYCLYFMCIKRKLKKFENILSLKIKLGYVYFENWKTWLKLKLWKTLIIVSAQTVRKIKKNKENDKIQGIIIKFDRDYDFS